MGLRPGPTIWTMLLVLGLPVASGCRPAKRAVLMVKILHAPAPGPQWRNPLPDTDEVRLTGANLYARHCSKCHGTAGKGDGFMAFALQPPPADLKDSKLTESGLYIAITEGKPGTAMPAYATLTDEERASVVRFVESIRDGPE